MQKMNELIYEFRGELLEDIHYGLIAGMDFSGAARYAVGDIDKMCYLRSCSKAIQCLPLFMHDFDRKFGFTDEEAAIFAASHYGQPCHIRALESILKKLGLTEDILIMKPTYPLDPNEAHRMIAEHMPKRKIYHNCAGKHLGMIVMSLGLGLSPYDYWKVDGELQVMIKNVIAQLSGFPADKIVVGVDGCGVPVYALPLKNCAMAFASLSDPSNIADEHMLHAIRRVTELMHKYPYMIEGEGTATTAMLRDPNILAKEGAEGMYIFALKKERVSFALKVSDGAHKTVTHVIQGILNQIHYDNPSLMEELYKLVPRDVYNDNDLKVGYIQDAFELRKM